MTTAERLADRAAFLARTFGEHNNGHYRLFDRSGTLAIGCDTSGIVSVILNGCPALFREAGPGGRVLLHGDYENDLCRVLGVPQEVAI